MLFPVFRRGVWQLNSSQTEAFDEISVRGSMRILHAAAGLEKINWVIMTVVRLKIVRIILTQ